jgi:putative glutamine amidotransferase
MVFITANSDKNLFTINKHYSLSLANLDIIPVLISEYNLSHINEILNRANGILLSGGGDIHPKFFKHNLNDKVNNINVARDIFEIELVRNALAKNLPILGICRGIQIINVALGGSISSNAENHMQDKTKNIPTHYVILNNRTKLHSIVQRNKIKVNSLHHQAIDHLGKNLVVSSLSEDKIIESVEHRNKKFVIGLQWHPEHLQRYSTQRKIFIAFKRSLTHR